MKKLELWRGKRFVPIAKASSERPWVKIIGGSMQSILPFILTGSVIFLYNVVRSYVPTLPNLQFIADNSFGMIALASAYMVTRQAMTQFEVKDYAIIAPLVSITTYLIYINPSVIDGNTIVDFGKFGPVGIFSGIVIGVITAQVFRLYSLFPLRQKLKESSMPDFISSWINSIIPITLAIVVASLFTNILSWDLFAIIGIIFAPIQKLGQSLPGLIILTLIPCVMMTMGISSWSFNAITTPIFMMGIQANIEAVAAGLSPTNIVTNETVYTASLITMGGIGCTLALNFLMLRSKSKKLKAMGRITITPSLFGINEPILFGAPVVMNPLLMLPAWICTIVGSIIVWTAMSLKLLNVPVSVIFTGQLPVGISSIIATNDWRGILWFALLLFVYTMIYRPFFKMFEKQVLENETE